MSSTNPAFVKTFARRNRTHSGSETQSAAPKKPGVARIAQGPAERQPNDPHDEPGSLKLDQSVAETASVWIDTNVDQISRADQPKAAPPTPHVAPAIVPSPPASRPIDPPAVIDEPHSIGVQTTEDASIAESLQHIHTAYAAPVEIEYESIDTLAPSLPESTQDNQVADPPQPTADEIVEPTESTSTTELRVDSPQSQPPKAHSHPAPLVPFQAVWEVDVFDIPRVVADLFFDGALFQQIAERMGEAVSSGLNSVLVTSPRAGEGRSSVAIGIAMAAAAAGIRVALVDADTEKPSLADDLRLDLQFGWVDTIRGGLPIAEVAVHAVEDGVTLIPLMQPHGATAATAGEVVQLLDVLRNRFELVIVDGPIGSVESLGRCASAVDTAIIVRDVSRTSASEVNSLSYRLREVGVRGVGVVENFA